MPLARDRQTRVTTPGPFRFANVEPIARVISADLPREAFGWVAPQGNQRDRGCVKWSPLFSCFPFRDQEQRCIIHVPSGRIDNLIS
jgi:hypothetical protein